MTAPLDRAWFARQSPVVAAELLNKVLVSRLGAGSESVSGRIVEVEAYDEADPASHTYVGRTSRNAVMFGHPGHLYVYLSYGIHRCANVVTGGEGSGQAVLLRSVMPLHGLELMRRRRGGRADRELADGPGKLCAALAIDLLHNGIDLTDPDGPVSIHDDGTPPPADPVVGPRVGITKAVDTPWRFRVPGGGR
jgi:DNA-3-methyladenine glycosylase